MDADVFISLTHFKGHEEAGVGGALLVKHRKENADEEDTE